MATLSNLRKTATMTEPTNAPRQTTTRPSKTSWSLVLLLLGMAATSQAVSAGQQSYVVRDSAGARIVEASRPQWSAGSAWRLGETPTLTIGTVAGVDATVFQRITAVTRLAGGEILVAEASTGEMRVFDRRATLVRSVGRSGEGPGEFRWLGNAWVRGESIGAYDNILHRVSIFSEDGELVETIRPMAAPGAGRGTVEGQFADGSFLAWSAPSGSVGSGKGLLEGATWRLDRYSQTGEFAGTIADLREGPRWGHDIQGLPPGMYLPFSPGIGSRATSGNDLYAGNGLTAEIRRWRNDGSLSLVIRWAAGDRRLSNEDKAKFRQANAEPPRGFAPEAWQRYLREVPFPERMPVYERIVVDSGGHVWARMVQASGLDVSTWYVFSADGIWLGRVEMPESLEVHEIGADYLLGVQRDELDVPFVVEIPVNRQGRGGCDPT